MQFKSFSIIALCAAGALALPAEPVSKRDSGHVIEARGCRATLPNCQGASYIGGDNCKCGGQISPCGNWKCGWDGAHSILNCGSQGSGCTWIN